MFRRVVLCISLCLLLFSSQAQSCRLIDYSKYGFSLGLNQSHLQAETGANVSFNQANSMGFRLGILAEYQLYNRFYLSPKAEIAFNNQEISLTDSNEEVNSFEIFPIASEFKAHLLYKSRSGLFSPYFLAGPSYAISNQENNYTPNTLWSMDFGVGFDGNFCLFIFSPELRYSRGLDDVIIGDDWQSSRLHTITLVFNFKG